MKKALKVTSWLCLLLAVCALIFGIFAFKVTNRSFFMGYAMFNTIRTGGVMGFIGNLFIVAFTVVCYGMAGLNALLDNKKRALVWSAITSVLAIVSLVIALFGHKLTFGDVLVTVIPIAQTLLVVKNAD
ncbi:MAG: hypothetical protein MR364_01095 [Oscillospiraceae bacterium]|nr:hypothetical protein [Oscillospiraceae bacterium]